MRLEPVSRGTNPVTVQCCDCLKICQVPEIHSPDSNEAFADLDGEPFEAYYCNECATKMTNPARP